MYNWIDIILTIRNIGCVIQIRLLLDILHLLRYMRKGHGNLAMLYLLVSNPPYLWRMVYIAVIAVGFLHSWHLSSCRSSYLLNFHFFHIFPRFLNLACNFWRLHWCFMCFINNDIFLHKVFINILLMVVISMTCVFVGVITLVRDKWFVDNNMLVGLSSHNFLRFFTFFYAYHCFFAYFWRFFWQRSMVLKAVVYVFWIVAVICNEAASVRIVGIVIINFAK